MTQTSVRRGFDPRREGFSSYTLIEGEMLEGVVERLPTAGGFHGRRLFIRIDSGAVLTLIASAKHGHAVLARELAKQRIQVGDHVRVTFVGWRQSAAERQYRHYRVERIG